MRRKGLGYGKGQGYKNLVPGYDRYVHQLSAKGVKSLHMMGLQDIRKANEDAARKSSAANKKPYVVDNIDELKDFPPFPFPYFGDYVPIGWKKVNEYFVDSSGFGQDDELSLSTSQFKKKIKLGKGYAITSAGQFQVYVGEYERTSKDIDASSSQTYDLKTRFDSRKSFGGKAKVEEQDGNKVLYSYGTKVAEVVDGIPKVYGTYSATTIRHIKEFLKQEGFKADTKSQIEEDYES